MVTMLIITWVMVTIVDKTTITQMKTRLFFALIALCCYSCAPQLYKPKIIGNNLEGVLPVVDGRVRLVETRTIDGVDPEVIFRQVRRWGALQVTDPAKVFSLGDNKLYDVVTGFYIPEYRIKASKQELEFITPRTELALIIECNKGSYRVTIGNFMREAMLGDKEFTAKPPQNIMLESPIPATKGQYISYLELIDRHLADMMHSLTTFVEKNIR